MKKLLFIIFWTGLRSIKYELHLERVVVCVPTFSIKVGLG